MPHSVNHAWNQHAPLYQLPLELLVTICEDFCSFDDQTNLRRSCVFLAKAVLQKRDCLKSKVVNARPGRNLSQLLDILTNWQIKDIELSFNRERWEDVAASLACLNRSYTCVSHVALQVGAQYFLYDIDSNMQQSEHIRQFHERLLYVHTAQRYHLPHVVPEAIVKAFPAVTKLTLLT